MNDEQLDKILKKALTPQREIKEEEIVLKKRRKPANKKSSVFLKKISKIRFDILCITFKPPEMPALKVVI